MRAIFQPRRAAFSLFLTATILAATGCGGDNTHRLSGKVTFQGKPVQSGRITFRPDDSKGNVGPSGYADIKDGEYDTSAPGGRGVFGGPTIALIEGYDLTKADAESAEAKGGPLFPAYQVAVDLGKADATQDFDVPKPAPRPARPTGGLDQ